MDGKFVTVLEGGGVCDLNTQPRAGDAPAWMCRFHTPWKSATGRMVSQCWVWDSWLRPIRPQRRDAVDEMVQIMRRKAPSPEFVGQTAFTDFGRRGWV
jgi:hypothetical protein